MDANIASVAIAIKLSILKTAIAATNPEKSVLDKRMWCAKRLEEQ